MPLPNNFNEIPKLHGTLTGENNQKPNSDLAIDKMAKNYTPKGFKSEPSLASVSRFAVRLIDRLTGKAYSADELAILDENGMIPVALLPSLSLTDAIPVANDAARLALTTEQAAGKAVVQANNANTYMLIEEGDPSVSGDWLKIGDNDPITVVTAVAAYELPIPSGTPVIGDKAKFYITASGANRSLTLAAGIRVPSDSGIIFPKTLTSGETYIVQIEYMGSFWMLTTVVGGGV